MYEIKKQIFLDFSKNQKSSICHYIKAFVKKFQTKSAQEILDSFLEDERYYLELNSSRFPFLADIIDEESFSKDALRYITECKKYYEMKEKQRPIIEANKDFEKKKRKFLQEIKMSKEPPTKKQVYYYEKLCKKYNIEKIELTSKLMARDEIDKIITEHQSLYLNDSPHANN